MSADPSRPWTLENLRTLYAKTGGKAWEPPNRDHPRVQALVAGGWVQHCSMRCMFEASDSGVKWTEAAHATLALPTPETRNA